MKLSPRGRTALWIGGGGFVGLAVGALVTNPRQAIDLSGVWVVAFAIFVGVVIGFTRTKTPKAETPAAPPKAPKTGPKPARPVPVAADPANALAIRFDLPDVPAGYPSVMGRGEPLQVKIIVTRQGEAAEGAAVQLAAAMDGETLTGDGITGTGGEVEFTLEPEGVGELTLTAEAKAGAKVGHGTTTVSIVDYEVEIERLFGEFRGYAAGVLGPEAHADTARELCDKLRYRADPQTARALLELARVYELVAYGERTADRRLYLAVLEQLLFLEHAELPDSSALSREA